MRFDESILVDIDGTILDSQKLKEEFRLKVTNTLHSIFERFEKEFALHHYDSVRHAQFARYQDARKNDPHLTIELALSSCDLPQAEKEKLIISLGQEYWKFLAEAKPYPETRQFLSTIKRKGYNILLFSDSSSIETFYKIQLLSQEVMSFIDQILCTDVLSGPGIIPLGYPKNVETYAFLRDRFKAKAMIGDSPLFDIQPAMEANLATALVKNGDFRPAYLLLEELQG